VSTEFQNGRIFRSISTPIEKVDSYEERNNGADRGLINAWQVGRELGKREPELVECALRGELLPLDFKGGINKVIKRDKIGSLLYLAKWQGLRGEDLDLNLHDDVVMVCSKFDVKVTFTLDFDRLKDA